MCQNASVPQKQNKLNLFICICKMKVLVIYDYQDWIIKVLNIYDWDIEYLSVSRSNNN